MKPFGTYQNKPVVVDPSLQQLHITRDPPSSKESDKVAFWLTSIKEKPLNYFEFQGNRAKKLTILLAKRVKVGLY